MVPFIRSLCITLCAAIYPFIPKLFNIFYMLAAKPTFFETERIQTLINNIYVLVSVVMLFALAVKAISSIVNPDNLWDSKKGVSGVLKRSVIALVLIVAIPFMFQYFYQFQTKIVSENLIEKLILGIDLDETMTDANGNEQSNNLQTQYEIGENLAAQAISAVLHPPADANGNTSTCSDNGNIGLGLSYNPITGFSGTVLNLLKGIGSGVNQIAMGGLCDNYQAVLNGDIDNLMNIAGSINNTTDYYVQIGKQLDNKHYVLEFEGFGLVGVAVGAVIVYFLIIFCIDSALRLVKLGFLEITAPMSIMAYIAGGNDVLKKWFNEVLSTLISLFLRIAAIAFLALLLEELPNFTQNLPSQYGNIIKLFIIIGALIFVKKVPELIEKITGAKLSMAGGISGRLGQMAGVGKVAQNAWKTLGGIGTTAAGFAAGALGGLAKAGINKLDNKFGKGEFIDNLKNNKKVQALTSFGKVAKAGISQGGNVGKTVKAMKSEYDKTPLAGDLKAKSELEKKNAQSEAIANRNIEHGFNRDGSTIKGNGESGKKQLVRSINGSNMNNAKKDALNSFSRISEASAELADAAKGQTDTKNSIDTIRERCLSTGNTAGADEASKVLAYAQNKEYRNAVTQAKYLKDSGIIDDAEYNKLMGSIKSQQKGLEALNAVMSITPELKDNESLKALFNPSTVLNASAFNGALDIMNGNSDKHISGILKSAEEGLKNMAPEGSSESKQIANYMDEIYRHNDQIVKDKKAGDFGGLYETIKFVDNNTQPTQNTQQQTTQQQVPNTQSQSNVGSSGSTQTTYGISQEAYDELINERLVTPGTQEFDRLARDYAGYNGRGGENNNQSLDNQNISSQNVTVNANTADVHSNTTNVYGNNTVNRNNFNSETNNEEEIQTEERTSPVNEQDRKSVV